MSTEARIVAPNQKIGARPTGHDAAATDQKTAKGGKKKLFIVVGAAVAVVALAGGYWFLIGPGKAASASAVDPSVEATQAPVYDLGEVLVIDSISINLQGGHYLRLGLGLQLIAGTGGEGAVVDSSKALDAAIALYSGHTTEELGDLAFREDLKKQLADTLFELYEGEVVAVYYTDFVTQ